MGHHCLKWSTFHDSALLHHKNLITQLADKVQVVGNKDQREIQILPQRGQQSNDLSLHHRVQSGHRFITDQNGRTAGQSTGNSNPLLLSAGKLVWFSAHKVY